MYELSTDLVEYSVDRTGEPIIHVFGRDKEGNAQQINVHGFRPYFYTGIDPNVLNTTEEDPWIDEIELTSDQINIQGDNVWRVFLKSPYYAKMAQQKFIHYEADVSYADRFVIDMGINTGLRVLSTECDVSEIEPIDIVTPIRVCIIDIEADSQDVFPVPEKNKINCITCNDSFTRMYDIFYLVNDENGIHDKGALTGKGWFDPDTMRLHIFTSEQDLLKALQVYVTAVDPDVLTGWNFTGFDMPYIMKRMDVLGLKPMEMGRLRGRFNPQWCSLKGRSEFDLLGGYKKITSGGKASYRLDAIAEEEIGEHKVHHSGTIHQLWCNDPAKFIEYNWKDVELCVKIDEKVKIVDFCRMLARHVGCSIDRSLHNSKIVDMYLLQYAHGRCVLPSSPMFMPEDEKFEGATVMDPFSGLEEYVVVLDLDSMYPSIMDTINASPETKDPDGEYQAPNGVRFKSQPNGVTRDIMRKLSTERKALKKRRDTYQEHDPEYVLLDMQQRVIKEVMNSYYGVSGYLKFRLYDQDFGGAVTSTGRALINRTKQVVEQHGYTVLYGDSVAGDSLIRIYNKHSIQIAVKEIQDLYRQTDITSIDGKEYYIPRHTTYTPTITSDNYLENARIVYIMRHRVHKQMYRITFFNTSRPDTPTHLDVTEDHSVFKYNSAIDTIEMVKPTDLKRWDCMLTHPWDENNYAKDYAPIIVENVVPIDYDGYVYDIEVDNDAHRFFANDVLVHNTDSVFVKLLVSTKEEAVKLGFEIAEIVNASYDEFAREVLGVTEHKFHIKFEKLYRRFFQSGRKKRYAVHIIWKEGVDFDKVDISGFEFKRSDTPAVIKRVQYTLLEKVIHGEDESAVKAYLREEIRKYRSGAYSLDEIGIPGGISKNLDQYEKPDANVRGAIYANTYLNAHFGAGSKPKRVYISTVRSRYPKTDVLCFEYGNEVPKVFVIDMKEMFERSFRGPIERVTKALGWEWEEFDPSMTTLASFGIGC